MKKNLFFSMFFSCLSFYLSDSFANPNLELTINDIGEETVTFQKKVKQPFEMKSFFECHKGFLEELLCYEQSLEGFSDERLIEIYREINKFISEFNFHLTKKYSIQPSDIVKIKLILDYCYSCLEKINKISGERWEELVLDLLKLDNAEFSI